MDRAGSNSCHAAHPYSATPFLSTKFHPHAVLRVQVLAEVKSMVREAQLPPQSRQLQLQRTSGFVLLLQLFMREGHFSGCFGRLLLQMALSRHGAQQAGRQAARRQKRPTPLGL